MTRLASFSLVFVLIVGCVSTSIPIEEVGRRAAFLAARPVLEKMFYAEAPIVPSNRELFPVAQALPGGFFNPRKYFSNRFQISHGIAQLPPGDYLIPVMTYCMKSSGSSPSAHRYQLAKLSGRAVTIIRDLNARALLRFQPGEIQAASWSIQNGVPYDEFSSETKKIVDATIPEQRKNLEKSFFSDFPEKWNGIVENTGLPRFDEVTNITLDNLGELGQEIRELRDFRRALQESGSNYENLNSLISLPGASENPGTETTTPWSRISGNVYARFLTTGRYLEVGQIQIRVVSEKRTTQALGIRATKIDITGLVADPGSGSIQPLSFSPLQASAVIPLLAAANSEVVAAFLAALIAAEYTDWQAVEKSFEQWGDSTQQDVRRLIEKLRQMYTQEFGPKPGQYVPPPAVPNAFPNLERAKGKTLRHGGGKRSRWKDEDGNIYEWDSQHGRLEKYDRRGNHQGEYDPNTGKQIKPRDPTRRVEP